MRCMAATRCRASENPMQPVIRLEAPVIQIHAVPKGEPVGYNGRWIAKRDSRIATVSCGYADGFPRNAGNNPQHAGGSAIVAGRNARLPAMSRWISLPSTSPMCRRMP